MSRPSALAAAPSEGQPKLLLCLSCAFLSPHSVHHESSASPSAKQGVFTQGCSTDGHDFAQYTSASKKAKAFSTRGSTGREATLAKCLPLPQDHRMQPGWGMGEGGWKVQRSVQRPWFYPSFREAPLCARAQRCKSSTLWHA